MQLPLITCSLLALASVASCRALRSRAGFVRQYFEIPCLETHASNGLANTSANNSITCELTKRSTSPPAPVSSNLTTQSPLSAPEQLTDISNQTPVTFHDPKTNTSAACAATFLSSSPPTERRSCSPDKRFGWYIGRFDDISSFELNLQHTYEDPTVGDPPWDFVTTFGSANITASSDSDPNSDPSSDANASPYACVPGTHEDRSCQIPAGKGPIRVAITEAIAKR